MRETGGIDGYFDAAYSPQKERSRRLGQQHGMVHHALTYHRSILQHLEVRSEQENMGGYSLQVLSR